MAFTLLGQILDIEWMLLRDEGRSAEELTCHDRQVLGQASAADAEQALRLWIEGRRRELHDRTLGVRVSEILTVLHVTLVVLAGAAGAGTAAAFSSSPAGREPTNVLHFLFATLVWPLLFLLGSVLVFSLRGRLGRSVLLADLYLLVLGLLGRLTRKLAHDDWDLAHEWRRLRRGARRYRDLEVGSLVSAAQWYALSFHLGAAASLLASALFSDLAFSWSTTNDSLDGATLAALFGVLTAPWCAALDTGCVSPELVAATQFSRFTGQYASPQGAALSGAWWPALVLCLLVYGVLPRLLFSLGLALSVRHRAARLSERVLELRGRLRAGVDVVTSPARSDVPEGAEPLPDLAPPRPRPGQGSEPCWVIRWRGAALDEAGVAALCGRLGLRAVRQDAAGGSDFGRDAALLEGSTASAATVLLVVEGWEAPDKATRRFVQELRQNGAPDRAVFVCVLSVAPDASELALWRDRLRLLQDPFVSVQSIAVSRDPPRLSSEVVR
ncbi:MAG: DUF2868 domain-containing protein [Deltaproteobacteria bacterium]